MWKCGIARATLFKLSPLPGGGGSCCNPFCSSISGVSLTSRLSLMRRDVKLSGGIRNPRVIRIKGRERVRFLLVEFDGEVEESREMRRFTREIKLAREKKRKWKLQRGLSRNLVPSPSFLSCCQIEENWKLCYLRLTREREGTRSLAPL